MNCPNCNKKPVGLFPGFRFHGLGFKKASKGYFKCKHCETLLIEESRYLFSKYERPYWLFLGGFMLLILGSSFFMLYLVIAGSIPEHLVLVGYMLFVIALFGVMDTNIKPRYWSIKEVEKSASEDYSPMRLTPKGWAIFGIYSIAAIALFILTPQLLKETQVSGPYILGGTFLYSVAVLGGTIFILTRFSIQENESAGDN